MITIEREVTRAISDYTEADVKKYYAAYNKAVRDGRSRNDVIHFLGGDHLLGYAKYALQYLAGKYPNVKITNKELYKLEED